MAFMAAAVPYITAAAAVMAASGSIAAANAQQQAGAFNAKVALQNAGLARENAQIEESRLRRMTMQRLGSMRAAVGASGIRLEGSPLDLLEESARQGELDAQLIRRQGELNAAGFQATASLETMRGSAAQTAGALAAGSQILSGAADTYAAHRSQGQGLKVA